jgi:hypothetical protein
VSTVVGTTNPARPASTTTSQAAIDVDLASGLVGSWLHDAVRLVYLFANPAAPGGGSYHES